MNAVPKKPRPQQPDPEKPVRLESLKERLVQHVLRGEHQSAEALRAEIHLLRARQLNPPITAANQETGASTAEWLVGDHIVETMELEATPEAREWFDEGEA